MLINIPDEFTMTQQEFDAMTSGLAKMLMFFCSGEKYKVIVEKDSERGIVTVKKEASED